MLLKCKSRDDKFIENKTQESIIYFIEHNVAPSH